jgi:hypothetical protein
LYLVACAVSEADAHIHNSRIRERLVADPQIHRM